MASIEDAAECGERANALVSGVLARVMRQVRSAAAAVDYVLALSRDTRANCWGTGGKGRARRAVPDAGPAQAVQGAVAGPAGRAAGLAAAVMPEDPGDSIGPGLAVDETADRRKGSSTACVAPQHADVTGKAENCVTWVFTGPRFIEELNDGRIILDIVD